MIAVEDARRVMAVLHGTRFTWATEAQLQEAMAAAFTAAGLTFTREPKLGPHERPDFLVGRAAVEVKVKGTWRDVARQIGRYCEHPDVEAVVLVTSKVGHTRVPTARHGKPVVVHLVGSVL